MGSPQDGGIHPLHSNFPASLYDACIVATTRPLNINDQSFLRRRGSFPTPSCPCFPFFLSKIFRENQVFLHLECNQIEWKRRQSDGVSSSEQFHRGDSPDADLPRGSSRLFQTSDTKEVSARICRFGIVSSKKSKKLSREIFIIF